MMQKIRLFDCHTHVLEHGFQKSLKVKETVRAAIAKDLSAICLTDHYPLPSGFHDPTCKKDCAMSLTLYSDYQQEVRKIIKKFGSRIEILKGVEFDWLPEYKLWIKKQIKKWNFDYVIGSVHFLGKIEDGKGRRNFILDYKEEELKKGITFLGGIKPFVKKYYQQIQSMAKSGLFDCIGHLDLIKKYNTGSFFSEDEQWYQSAVLETLEVIKKVNMVVEINTSGLDKKCKKSYPSLWILQEAKKRDIPIAIGSDAHTPETIGRNLEAAVRLAKTAGYLSLVKFINREKKEVVI